jgi:hypothetical protein
MKRRSVPLGCAIAFCIVWLCLMMFITFEFFSETNNTEEYYKFLATQAQLNADHQMEALKTTSASLSATMNYFVEHQQLTAMPR